MAALLEPWRRISVICGRQVHLLRSAGCVPGDKQHAHPQMQDDKGKLTPEAKGAVDASRAYVRLIEGAGSMSPMEFQQALRDFINQYLDQEELPDKARQDKKKDK